jgi:hypothetical protein
LTLELVGTLEVGPVLQMLQESKRTHTRALALNRSTSIFFWKASFDQGFILIPMSLFTPGAAACCHYRIHPRPTRKHHTPCSCTTFAMPAQQTSSFSLEQRDLRSENGQEGQVVIGLSKPEYVISR